MTRTRKEREQNQTPGRILALGFLIGLFTAVIPAQNSVRNSLQRGRRHVFLLEANMFQPAAKSMRDLYGGGTGFGGELNFRIWKSMRIWTAGNFYSGKGSLPISGEETKIRISIIQAGLLVKPISGLISPYAGTGAEIYFYRESNTIGTAEGSQLGWTGRAGFHIQPADFLLFDLGAAYSTCKVRPQRIEADLGGWRFRLGLGFAF